ncbi:MAG: hypothetical protein EON51_02170 [Acinetobacter sp.]|nr:MAG: hypothetical protein EON51_02170 [Acinetobacter sp.]
MNDIKSLADQLRNKIAEPNKDNVIRAPSSIKKSNEIVDIDPISTPPENEVEILLAIKSFEYSNGKNMLHPRVDDKTIKILNQFKIATGVDMNRTIAFSIHFLFAKNPELKTIIKKSLENFEL